MARGDGVAGADRAAAPARRLDRPDGADPARLRLRRRCAAGARRRRHVGDDPLPRRRRAGRAEIGPAAAKSAVGPARPRPHRQPDRQAAPPRLRHRDGRDRHRHARAGPACASTRSPPARRRRLRAELLRRAATPAPPSCRPGEAAPTHLGGGAGDGPAHGRALDAPRRAGDRRGCAGAGCRTTCCRRGRCCCRSRPSARCSTCSTRSGSSSGSAASSAGRPRTASIAPTREPWWAAMLLVLLALVVLLVIGAVGASLQFGESWWRFRLTREPSGTLHLQPRPADLALGDDRAAAAARGHACRSRCCNARSAAPGLRAIVSGLHGGGRDRREGGADTLLPNVPRAEAEAIAAEVLQEQLAVRRAHGGSPSSDSRRRRAGSRLERLRARRRPCPRMRAAADGERLTRSGAAAAATLVALLLVGPVIGMAAELALAAGAGARAAVPAARRATPTARSAIASRAPTSSRATASSPATRPRCVATA